MQLSKAFVLSAVLVAALSAAACGRVPKGEQISPAGGVFDIDTRGMAPGQVRFFRFESGGKSIVFFVARGSDGSIKTAFDACRSCYPRKLGYRAGEGSVTCAACGMVFKLDELDVGEGNCIPVSLPSRSLDGKVIVDSKEVESGAQFF